MTNFTDINGVEKIDIFGVFMPPSPLSLKASCLKECVRSVERYNEAFLNSPDINTRMNLHHLRKYHSSYLIDELTQHEKLDRKYWKFLVNEYLEELDFHIMHCVSDITIIIEHVAKIAHSLQKVIIGPPDYRCFDEQHFVNKVVCLLSGLKVLTLRSHCADETLKIISSSCPKLEELYLECCFLTSDGLQSLCQEKDGEKVNRFNLKVLTVFPEPENDIDDGVRYLLQNMTSLEVVNLSNLSDIICAAYSSNVNKSLVTKYNLTYLNIGINSTATSLLTVITNVCPSIEHLCVGIACTHDLQLISRLSKLENLEICQVFSDRYKEKIDINNFLIYIGRQLKRLVISFLHFSVRILVQSCPNLKILHLKHVHFESLVQNKSLKQLYKLHELLFVGIIFNNSSSRQSLSEILHASCNLKQLIFTHCHTEINEELVLILHNFCEKNHTLERLDFSGFNIKHRSFLAVLLKCCRVKRYLSTINLNAIGSYFREQAHQEAAENVDAPLI